MWCVLIFLFCLRRKHLVPLGFAFLGAEAGPVPCGFSEWLFSSCQKCLWLIRDPHCWVMTGLYFWARIGVGVVQSNVPLCNGECSAETGESQLENRAGTDAGSLFKRKTLRLGKYLLKVKVYGKCLPSEQKETSRVGENGGIWLFLCKEGWRAGWSLIFGWNWDSSSCGWLEVRLCSWGF